MVVQSILYKFRNSISTYDKTRCNAAHYPAYEL